MREPRTIVALVGATATGKSDVGEALAEAVGGEVVCADARQVFRELEIGTGKPTPAARAARAHHLFDALALGEAPSAGWYARAASAACEALFARGVTPVLVGGTGLYLRALMQGLHALPPQDAGIRARLMGELETSGAPALHARLAAADAVTAARLEPGDSQRIVRALEVLEVSGRPLAWWHAQEGRAGLAADWRVLELTLGSRALASRIERRTYAMFGSGLLEETQALLARGLGAPLAALRAIGYDEARGVLAGQMTLAEAQARTNLRTRQLAKRQRTWFRHQVEALRMDADAPAAELAVTTLARLRL